MKYVDTSSWKEFKIGDIFDVDNLWVYGKNKQYLTRFTKPSNKSIAVVSGTTENNGINYYTEDEVREEEIYEDCLTISTRGEYSGSVFYHDYRFVLANNILVMPMPGLSKEAKLFMATLIEKLPFGGYSNYPTKEKLKECAVKLPVTEIQEIDWDYMNNYIIELENEYVAEKEQEHAIKFDKYLEAAGLDDCELTEEEKSVYDMELVEGASGEYEKEAREFAVDRLFTLKKITKKLSKLDLSNKSDKCKFPVYSSDSKNNGVIGYSDTSEFECNCKHPVFITFGDHTRTFNIARENFAVLDNVKVLEPCCNDDDVLTYLTSTWRKGIMDLGYSRHWKLAKDCLLLLPIQTDQAGTPIIDQEHKFHKSGFIPDWDFMKKYVKAAEKEVIKELADENKEKVKKMKGEVEKNGVCNKKENVA